MDCFASKRVGQNVSVTRDFWSYLGDYQPKVSQSYTPERWGDAASAVPSYTAGLFVCFADT